MIKLILLLINVLVVLALEIFIFDIKNIIFEVLLGIALFALLCVVEVIIFFLTALIFGLGDLGKDNTRAYNKGIRKIFVIQEKILLSLFSVKINLINADKLPEGNCVIVANHQSNLDSICTDVAIKKDIVYVAKKQLFKIPFFGRVIQKIGYIKLDRGNIRQEVKAIKYGIDLINNDKISVGVFPEGTRNFTEDEVLLPFKDGCFRLVTKTNVPLVVLSIKGTSAIKHNKYFKRHNVDIKVLDCITSDRYQGLSVQEIGDNVRSIMYEDLKDYKRS